MGVLGHVDSGKTSLCRMLSQLTSTASLDKGRQSQERGITLDLGFSCFYLPVNKPTQEVDQLQITLVDCPGHASLIKTVIGGAQIIDSVLLVIDLVKGIQTQTAECLVIAQVLNKPVFVVFNKCDLVGDPAQIEIVRKKTCMQLTKLGLTYEYAIVSAATGQGIDGLKTLLSDKIVIPERDHIDDKQFSILVDHCFALQGKGVVSTGTVLRGRVRVGDIVEYPQLTGSDKHKKIGNLQMFRRNVKQAQQGDRVAMLMKAFDCTTIERCIVSSKALYRPYSQAIFTIQQIKYFRGRLESKQKMHITSGHQTIMATLYFIKGQQNEFSMSQEYEYASEPGEGCFLILDFEQPMLMTNDSLIIGSNLAVTHKGACRLAFHGQFIQGVNLVEQELVVVRHKSKQGVIDRVIDGYTVLVVGLFKKQSNIQIFIGYEVQLEGGLKGKVQASFGNSGKVKVELEQSLPEETWQSIKGSTVSMVYKKRLLNKKQNR